MTKTSTNALDIRAIQGFAAHAIRNDEVELMVVPELGAKVISLKNVRTRREWLWHPGDRLKLFRNRPRDDFFASPLAGIDECLPTISPCVWRGRDLPDHGEVWNQPWEVDDGAWQNGMLATSIKLKASPLLFKRTIELHGNRVEFEYQLTNLSGAAEEFIWAIHPLVRLQPGDALELPRSTRKLLNGETWIDAVATVIPEKGHVKVFASPLCEGWAAIRNQAQNDQLELAWDPAQINTLGLWLTRGGWHGHHHFAIEPTHGNHDSLVAAVGGGHCGKLPARGSLKWNLSLRVGPVQ